MIFFNRHVDLFLLTTHLKLIIYLSNNFFIIQDDTVQQNDYGWHCRWLMDCRLKTQALDGCEWSASRIDYLHRERDLDID
jgi:hypothetical protein